MLRLGEFARLRRVILPGAAPGIFAGLRLALIYAWLGNIGAEYFMSSGVGIGSLMINAQQLLDMPTILCGMVLVGITGAALDKAGRYWKCAPPAGVNRSSYDLFNSGLFSPRA